MTDGAANAGRDRGYEAPVAILLTEDGGHVYDPEKWPDYPARFGLAATDVAALTRMSLDMALHASEALGNEIWAPVHAWRALGQLRAAAAAGPLLAGMPGMQEAEAPFEEIGLVLGMMGPEAIPAIAAFLQDRTIHPSVACTAMTGLTEIATKWPEQRMAVIEILAGSLTNAETTNPGTNGWTVGALMDLKAVEAIETIRAAFKLDAVDISMAGDVEDVEIAFELRTTRSTAPLRRPVFIQSGRDDEMPPLVPNTSRASPAPAAVPPKIGRNEPCPCGSGKKYKKCCLV